MRRKWCLISIISDTIQSQLSSGASSSTLIHFHNNSFHAQLSVDSSASERYIEQKTLRWKSLNRRENRENIEWKFAHLITSHEIIWPYTVLCRISLVTLVSMTSLLALFHLIRSSIKKIIFPSHIKSPMQPTTTHKAHSLDVCIFPRISLFYWLCTHRHEPTNESDMVAERENKLPFLT
jgi:hypothetical protein